MREITFTIRNAYGPDTSSRLVDVEDASFDLQNMENADDIVAPNDIVVCVGFPLTARRTYRLKSANEAGFTRAGIARAICRLVKIIWSDDEAYTMRQIEIGTPIDDIEDKYGVPADIELSSLQLTAIVVNADRCYEPVFEI